MGGPAWLADIFAVLMLVVAVYCAIRLVLGPVLRRSVERDIDVVHLVMGVTMAGMLVPSRNPLAGSGWSRLWEVFFTIAVVWFVVRAVLSARQGAGAGMATGHYLPHAVHSGTMVYMFLALPAASATGPMAGMGGMGGAAARLPTLALVLSLFMMGYAVVVIDRITPRPAVDRAAHAPATSAHVTNGSGGVATLQRSTTVDTTKGSSALLAPRSAACYKIAMSIVMGYMLVTML